MKPAKNYDAIEIKEENFHDQWAANTDVTKIKVDELFESNSAPENKQILSWMGDIKGKRILEIGCGLGESSVYFAKKGADVTASDISSGMLDVTLRLAQLHNVTLKTIKVSAQDLTAIPDNYFDYIYAANLLHHVDIPKFISEAKTKLKNGGEAFFWDPVHYNPAIQVYRGMATQVRTTDEHPLKIADITFLRGQFKRVEITFFWFSALSIFFKFFLIDRIHPNQARYWKKILEEADRLKTCLGVFHTIDRIFFSWVPGLRWLAWNIVIRCKNS